MDLLEKINKSLSGWYDALFGAGEDVRPKDILEKILAELEECRQEGLDNLVYVPNQYIIVMNIPDAEEKDFLLSFLDQDELETAVRRYCDQNNYHIRGTLDFTIVEAPVDPNNRRREKVSVRSRYNRLGGEASVREVPRPILESIREPAAREPVEDRTVAGVIHGAVDVEGGTVPSVAAATLLVTPPDRPEFPYSIAKGAITIGRSAKADNDLVISSDGQISKRHARIELDADGRFTLYDLNSTNGVRVNGQRVDNRTLANGDLIQIGATRILFQQSADSTHEPILAAPPVVDRFPAGGSRGAFGHVLSPAEAQSMPGSVPPSRTLQSRPARLVVIVGEHPVDEYLLGQELTLGRGITNDVTLPERSVATRHARIYSENGLYLLEELDKEAQTLVNGVPVSFQQPLPLQPGDRIRLGERELIFEAGRE